MQGKLQAGNRTSTLDNKRGAHLPLSQAATLNGSLFFAHLNNL